MHIGIHRQMYIFIHIDLTNVRARKSEGEREVMFDALDVHVLLIFHATIEQTKKAHW